MSLLRHILGRPYRPGKNTAYANPGGSREARLIAYYLPQFHSIPENDEWWGEGFTEWTNVRPAQPLFDGHDQPRIPADLGYYDLRDPEVMRRQVGLAKQYGIGAFAFHFYWFGGKRLLELPVENYLSDLSLELPFCLCWANENWTRRWSGREKDVLIAQDHSPEDDIAFIRYLDRYFRDSRYLKVDGKPVLTVYRPDELPDARATIARWRAEVEKLGYTGIYLIATNAFDYSGHRKDGFDALSEFPPHGLDAPDIQRKFQFRKPREGGRVRDYAAAAGNAMRRPSKGTVHPGVMPSWDNTARRPTASVIYHGATPTLFRQWLEHALKRAANNPDNARFVFINAWNEWAEGAYLEPDQKFGHGYLQACADALRAANTEIRAAIIVHAYYPDLLEEILDYIKPLPARHKLFVTTVAAHEETVRRQLQAAGREFTLRVYENRGRDILPFLRILPDVQNEGFLYFLKLHTKKTPQRRDGNRWRKDILDKLLGGERLEHALKMLADDPSVGLIGPEGHFVSMTNYFGANEERVLAIGRRLGLSEETVGRQGFFAGSMFVGRMSAIKSLLDFGFVETDFESEQSQKDGTLAHVLERAFSLFVHAAGMRSAAGDGSGIARTGYAFARKSGGRDSRRLTPLQIKLRAAWRHPLKSWKRKAYRSMNAWPSQEYLDALESGQEHRNHDFCSLQGKRVAVFYLARGGTDALDRFKAFVRSYKNVPAGMEHDLFVILKGFQTADEIEAAKSCFAGLDYRPLHTDDDNFDLGAYRAAVDEIDHEYVCFLNSNSELVGDGWLAKLMINLCQPDVGLVGATGSFESLVGMDRRFPHFPNIHIRSNAFAIRREHFLTLVPMRVPGKVDAFLIESGPAGLTRRMHGMGLSALVVGRDGQGYLPPRWPLSRTYRHGDQDNLLVQDNVTRDFDKMLPEEKQAAIRRTWGNYLSRK